MQLYYPRSFLKLILAGFSLAVLPLIFALINNAFSIHQLATHSQRAVYQAVQATQNSRFLIEQITNMERSVRQFAIIGEPSLLQGYGLAHERFVDTAQQHGDVAARFPAEASAGGLRTSRIARCSTEWPARVRSAKSSVWQSRNSPHCPKRRACSTDQQGNLLVDREVDTMQKDGR